MLLFHGAPEGAYDLVSTIGVFTRVLLGIGMWLQSPNRLPYDLWAMSNANCKAYCSYIFESSDNSVRLCLFNRQVECAYTAPN